MAALKAIELELEGTKDLALIAMNDSVWLVVPRRWWDFATLLFWVFVPMDRRASVKLTMHGGEKVSLKAVRVATRHVRVRNFSG